MSSLFQLQVSDPFQLTQEISNSREQYIKDIRVTACNLVLKKEREYYDNHENRSILRRYCKFYKDIVPYDPAKDPRFH